MSVQTIWAVTNQEYSYGGIACLFISKELAEQYADALNHVIYEHELAEEPYEKWLERGWGRHYFVEDYQLWSTVPVVGGHDGEDEWNY
jgi:hypothetical protein